MLQRGGKKGKGRKEGGPCLSVVSPTQRRREKGKDRDGKGMGETGKGERERWREMGEKPQDTIWSE